MMVRLGVRDEVAQAMAAEVNQCDNRAVCPESHLATILKIIGAQIPDRENDAVEKVLDIISAVHWKIVLGPYKPEKSFMDYVAAIVESRRHTYVDMDALEALMGLLEEESVSISPTLFGLRSIYTSLCSVMERCPETFPRVNVLKIMGFLIDVLYQGQVSYHTFKRHIEASAFRPLLIPVECGREVVDIPVAIVDNPHDNPCAHKVLRAKRVCMSVVVSSIGNPSVQCGHNSIVQRGIESSMIVGMENLTAMFRCWELPANTRPQCNWNMMRRYGECLNGTHYYLDDRGRFALYRGTLVHPAPRPVNRLSPRDIHMMLDQAFIPQRAELWRERMGVLDPRLFSEA